MALSKQHATILTGRIGSVALLQLDIGGMNPVMTKQVPVDRLDQLQDGIATRFAVRLRAEGISPSYLHPLDGTHLMKDSKSGECKTLSPESLGACYVESFYYRVVREMRRGECI